MKLNDYPMTVMRALHLDRGMMIAGSLGHVAEVVFEEKGKDVALMNMRLYCLCICL